MKKITARLIFSMTIMLPLFGWAQPARVQVIHNCADALASQVDVYLNGEILLDNFAFRTATPFVPITPGVPQTLQIAPANSTSAGDAIFTKEETFQAGQTYILVANGIINVDDYDPDPEFKLDVFVGGREAAVNSTQVDVLVHHGSTDAPTVDVVETLVGAGPIVEDLEYGTFAGYLSLPEQDFQIDIRDSSGTITVASYSVPLQSLNLEGAALTVVASGFLTPVANSNGPAFGLFVATPLGGPLLALPLVEQDPTARIQIIHNSADALAEAVDVYLNDELIIDDFAFRSATPFVPVPAGVELNIEIAASNSTDSSNPLYTITPTLEAGETYVAIASGLIDNANYTPFQPFEVRVFPLGREAAEVASNTDVLVFHGATDAPAVDVFESSVPAGTVVEDIAFGEFQGYLPLPTGNYTLDVQDATGTVTVASFQAPLETLQLQGAALTVMASGFLNPAANNNGAPFGLFAVLANGDVVPLPASTARAQIIHNCADALAAQVDVYVNGDLTLDNFAFRTASPFVNLPANVPVTIQITGADAPDASNPVFEVSPTLTANETYVIVANGIIDAANYSPAPTFGLDVFAAGREAATQNGNTDVLVIHGSTDAPTVDVVETNIPAGTIVEDLEYKEFAGYLELATANYTIDIRDESGTVTVATYAAPLADLNLQGTALTVLASGFLNPAVNNNGPAFGLWVALPQGGSLIPLPSLPLSNTDFAAAKPVVYPNPANSLINVMLPEFSGDASAILYDMSGRQLATYSNISGPLDVSSLSTGMYMLTVNAGGKVFTSKFNVSK